MKAHQFASLFPMLADAELQALADDISANGLQTPIVTLDSEILDGRNRYRACEIAGVDPTFEEYLGADPLGFVVSHNLHRRHLSTEQRAMVASRLANLSHGGQGGKPINVGIPTLSQPAAAEMLNVSRDSVTQARKIEREGAPELVEAVMSGGVSLAAAVEVASLPKDEQAAIVKDGKDAIKQAAKVVRESAAKSVAAVARTPKFIPDDADRLWLIAQSHLDKILPSDSSRERVLREVVAYAEKRIADGK